MIRVPLLARRILSGGFAFFISITITFFILHLMPGDYITNYLASLGLTLPQETVDAFYHQFGLDLPLTDQYVLYLRNILGGDWGYSYQFSVPILPLILEKLSWTLVILLPATIIGSVAGIALGAFSGWKSGSRLDLAIFNAMIIIRAVPSYWWAIMAVLVFSYTLGLFPLGGYTSISILYSGIDGMDVLCHAVLPIAVSAFFIAAGNYYMMRNSMLTVVGEDYIATARSKGLSENAILWRHACRNALLPMVTITTLELASIISGSIFIETVFSWPGVGMLTTEALRARDLPLLEGIFLLDTLLVIVANIVADVLYPFLDPRIRTGD